MISDAAKEAYRLIKGKPYPDDPRPQDSAIAELCLNEMRRHNREWQAQERAAKRAVDRMTAGPMLEPAALSERQIQLAAALRLDTLGLVWIHVPNEGRRSRQHGADLRDQGLKAGFPDILIFTPPPKFPRIRFVAIEIKRAHGGKVSRAQREWLHELRECQGIAEVCRGLDQFISILKRLGYE